MPRAFSMSIQSETVPRRPALPWIAPASVAVRLGDGACPVSLESDEGESDMAGLSSACRDHCACPLTTQT